MKVININLKIYGISVKGTISIDDKEVNSGQTTIFDEMKASDGFEKTELLNHDSRQVITKGIKERICSVAGCFRKVFSKSYCSKHYQMNRRFDLKEKRGGVNYGDINS